MKHAIPGANPGALQVMCGDVTQRMMIYAVTKPSRYHHLSNPSANLGATYIAWYISLNQWSGRLIDQDSCVVDVIAPTKNERWKQEKLSELALDQMKQTARLTARQIHTPLTPFKIEGHLLPRVRFESAENPLREPQELPPRARHLLCLMSDALPNVSEPASE